MEFFSIKLNYQEIFIHDTYINRVVITKHFFTYTAYIITRTIIIMKIYVNEMLFIPHNLYNIQPQSPRFFCIKLLIIVWAESMCILSKMSRFHIIDCNKPVLYTGIAILT